MRTPQEIQAALTKAKDPKEQAELAVELYESLDDVEMEAAETAWERIAETGGDSGARGSAGSPEPVGGTSVTKRSADAAATSVHPHRKALLSPRNLPPADAPEGLREAEEALMQVLSRAYDRAVRELRILRGRRLTGNALTMAVGDVMERLRSGFIEAAMSSVDRIYQVGVKAERPMAEFGGLDEAVLRSLREDPTLLAGQLSKVVTDAGGVVNEAIRESFRQGIDLPRAIDSAASQLDEERWKVERVVRTQSSQIVNRAHVAQIEKRGPDQLVEVVTSQDLRVCPICIDASNRNPWTVESLKAATHGRYTFHPNDRCTVVRYVALP